METTKRVREYIRNWMTKGYPDDIPDEVPHVLMKQGLAPSYKAICLALLSNDMNLESLGFTAKKSKWYSAFKKVEIEERIRTTGSAKKPDKKVG
jgi:predicted phosphoadenosine phosphosulfate sulfurtransferase